MQWRCQGCGAIVPYDGGEDGILNLDNLNLFTHQLLKWHCIQVATMAAPFYSFWRTVVNYYASAGLPADRADWFLNKRLQ